jgi:hypothetical protein
MAVTATDDAVRELVMLLRKGYRRYLLSLEHSVEADRILFLEEALENPEALERLLPFTPYQDAKRELAQMLEQRQSRRRDPE